jgi:hypothetical protein
MGSQLASECPKGHPLSPPVTPVVGGCDGPCGRKVGKGEMVRDFRQCNYYICSSCVPTCRNGHALAPRITPTGGGCDGPCRRKVGKGESVFDCRQCNWYLCTTCMPLKEAVKASSGGPGVDMRSVAEALPWSDPHPSEAAANLPSIGGGTACCVCTSSRRLWLKLLKQRPHLHCYLVVHGHKMGQCRIGFSV